MQGLDIEICRRRVHSVVLTDITPEGIEERLAWDYSQIGISTNETIQALVSQNPKIFPKIIGAETFGTNASIDHICGVQQALHHEFPAIRTAMNLSVEENESWTNPDTREMLQV